MTATYLHGRYSWNQQLRKAVTRLHTPFCPTGSPIEEPEELVRVANYWRDEGNVWWSQRDSNPCLSLERAPS